MYLPAGWKIINPKSNPMSESGEELANIDEVEEFAISLANEVYKSLTWSDQPATVKAFARKKFQKRYQDLMES